MPLAEYDAGTMWGKPHPQDHYLEVGAPLPPAPCTPTCLLLILKANLMDPAYFDIVVGAVQVPGTASHASDDEDDRSSDATSSVSRCAWLPVTAARLCAAGLANGGLY